MAHGSIVGSDSIISGDFVNPVPPMLVGLSIRGLGTCFLLPQAGMPLPKIAPTDATHVSPLPLIKGFPFFALLFALFDFLCFAGACFFCSDLVYYHG